MIIKIISIFAIVIGITMMAYSGFNFVTNESVIDMGTMHVTRERNHMIQWPPIAGVILLVGGIVGIILDRRASKAS